MSECCIKIAGEKTMELKSARKDGKTKASIEPLRKEYCFVDFTKTAFRKHKSTVYVIIHRHYQ